MGFHAMDYSVNIVAYEKNGKKMGMCCAWAMQVDYDKLVCLLGAQSSTGAGISVGDKVGVSALNPSQKEIAVLLGEGHSAECDKFKNIEVEVKNGAILIPHATRQMECEVIDVLHLPQIEEDYLVYVKIVSSKEDGNLFLHFSEL